MSTKQKGYKDPEVLRALYWVEDMSLSQIAERFGVHEKTIWNWFEKYDIARHNLEKAPNGRPKKHTVSYGFSTHNYCAWSGTTDVDGFSTTFVHQLLAVSEGADPHKVYSGGEYHVHHKNGITWDNRPENITLMSASEHMSHHRNEDGIGYTGREKQYTKEDCIEWLEAFVDEFGMVPTAVDIHGWPGPSLPVYRDRFGSWTKAVQEAGFEPRGKQHE